jgi:hypothetical protein
MVNRINTSGCRVTLPYKEPSPMKILFDGEFTNAEYIPSYPATLHIFGFPGQLAMSDITEIEQISSDKYVIRYGSDSLFHDIMVRIVE